MSNVKASAFVDVEKLIIFQESIDKNVDQINTYFVELFNLYKDIESSGWQDENQEKFDYIIWDIKSIINQVTELSNNYNIKFKKITEIINSYINGSTSTFNISNNKTSVGFEQSNTAKVVEDITQLVNTLNFAIKALKHILEGEVNSIGKAVGFHYEGLPTAKGSVIPGTELPPNNQGIYKAKVEVNGIAKTANGGESTFFPKGWSAQQIVDAINEAFENKNFVSEPNTYVGNTSSGVDIMMYINNNTGKIISAFPLY